MLLTDLPGLTYYYWPGKYYLEDGAQFAYWASGAPSGQYRCYAVDTGEKVWRVHNMDVSHQPHSQSAVYYSRSELLAVGFVLKLSPTDLNTKELAHAID